MTCTLAVFSLMNIAAAISRLVAPWPRMATTSSSRGVSSVIPPGSVVEPCERLPTHEIGDWGDRLHVVYAAQAASELGGEAWAGVGWVRDPSTGRGLFVEHEGPEEHAVRADIKASLDDLQATRAIDFGDHHSVVVGGRCLGQPICALVLCGFSAVSWQPHARQRTWPVRRRRSGSVRR